MTYKEFKKNMGFSFVLPHNPGNYPQIVGNAKEQALGIETFPQNQAFFRKYTAVGGAFKNMIVTVVEQAIL